MPRQFRQIIDDAYADLHKYKNQCLHVDRQKFRLSDVEYCTLLDFKHHRIYFDAEKRTLLSMPILIIPEYNYVQARQAFKDHKYMAVFQTVIIPEPSVTPPKGNYDSIYESYAKVELTVEEVTRYWNNENQSEFRPIASR